MWGYYHYSVMYGAWRTPEEAREAAIAAGHFDHCAYELVLSNDPRPVALPAPRRLSADDEFLALGQ